MWTEHMDFRRREHSEYGSEWWPYEQTAYYLDGALRCANMLESPDLLADVRADLQHVVDRAEPNGRLRAGNIDDDSWPIVVIMRALFAEYDATKSELLLAAIEKHYRHMCGRHGGFSFPEGAGFEIRSVLNIEHLCRLMAGATGCHAALTAATSGFHGMRLMPCNDLRHSSPPGASCDKSVSINFLGVFWHVAYRPVQSYFPTVLLHWAARPGLGEAEALARLEKQDETWTMPSPDERGSAPIGNGEVALDL
jgi:hypothetical protein